MAGAISGGPISGSLTVRDAAALWFCDVPDVVHAIACDVARLGVLGPGIQRLALIGPLLRAIITDMNSGRLNSGDVAISSATLIRRTASIHCADMLVPAGPVPCATLRGSAQQNSLNYSLPVPAARSPTEKNGALLVSADLGSLLRQSGTLSCLQPAQSVPARQPLARAACPDFGCGTAAVHPHPREAP
jgi:hypothetical protein